MPSKRVRVRRPASPTDALSSDLREEVEVVLGRGGKVTLESAENSELYRNDPAFLRALLGALQEEVASLEKENKILLKKAEAIIGKLGTAKKKKK